MALTRRAARGAVVSQDLLQARRSRGRSAPELRQSGARSLRFGEASRQARGKLRPVARREERVEPPAASSVARAAPAHAAPRRGARPAGASTGRGPPRSPTTARSSCTAWSSSAMYGGQSRQVFDRAERGGGRRPAGARRGRRRAPAAGRRPPGRRRAARAWLESRFWRGAAWSPPQKSRTSPSTADSRLSSLVRASTKSSATAASK